MSQKKVLVISDNEFLLNCFIEMLKFMDVKSSIQFSYSYNNDRFKQTYKNQKSITPVNVKKQLDELIINFQIIFSLHCKQIFPAELVNQLLCINIHPGLNPYNRGWYPHVFSIINKKSCGATIHIMDEKIDHGPIIAQREIKIESWDTSLSVYNRILDAELVLLKENFKKILNDDYKVFVSQQGNLNRKKDYQKLCKINLDEKDTFLNHLNHLRALSHGEQLNAFFFDENNIKIFVKLYLFKAE